MTRPCGRFSSRVRLLLHGVLLATGFLSVGLGIAGIFLPVLPTTPFLLLAGFCFARTSPRFHHWLLNNRLCGPYLRRFRDGERMKLSDLVTTLLVMWASIALTVWLVNRIHVTILLSISTPSVTAWLIYRYRRSQRCAVETSMAIPADPAA